MFPNRKIYEIIECQSLLGESHIAEIPIRLSCGFSMCNSCYKIKKTCKLCKVDHLIEEETNNEIFVKIVKDNVKDLMNDLKSKLRKDQIEFKNEG
jgi:hypothetical protein